MYELFFILGLTIFIGFVAILSAERLRISQVLVLMLFGFVLGPLLNIVDVSPSSTIVSILPFIATLALIVLLFDAGLNIDVFALSRSVPKGMLFTILVFLLSLVLVTLFSMLLLGWSLLHCILLGAVVGGTSSAIVMTMVQKTNISKEAKSVLAIESTLTDALSIIIAVIVIQLILAKGAPDASAVLSLLLSSFTFALMLGVLFAALWIAAIIRFRISDYAYILTLALVFGLYASTEAVRGNGGFAVFVFALILGNAKKIGDILRLRGELSVSPKIQFLQEEITFFVRTFFFVYIGLLFSLSYFTFPVVVVSLFLLGIFVFARWLMQRFTLPDLTKKDKNIIVAMLPKGLAAAVLVTMAISSGIILTGFQELVFVVILLSNILATAGIFVLDRPHKKAPENILEEELDEPLPEEAEEKEREEEEEKPKKRQPKPKKTKSQ